MKAGLMFAIGLFLIIFLIEGVKAADCGGEVQCNCGDTLVASQVMNYDILNCPEDGLYIHSSNIVLDCAGHSIDGAGLADYYEGRGISTDFGSNEVYIKNCNITNFIYGIYFPGGGLIDNNSIGDNAIGIYTEGGVKTISNNKIFSNNEGINSCYGSNGLIFNNSIFNNGNGIARVVANTPARVDIIYNDIYNNSASGIFSVFYHWGTTYNPNDNISLNNFDNNINLAYWSFGDERLDFLVQNNWWGTTNQSEIDKTMLIYGGDLGITFTPFLCGPYPTDWVSDNNGNCVLDLDNDGVLNSEDKCPNTIGTQIIYGCSCEQILALKPGENTLANREGCSKGVIDVFTKATGWAKDLFINQSTNNTKPSHPNINSHPYNTCQNWEEENGNWTWCEKGYYFEKLNIDNEGKGHSIFHNVGQIDISFNGEEIYRGVYQDQYSAQTPAGENPHYYYDWNTFIFKSERNYEFMTNETGTFFCIYKEFTKETNDRTIFNRVTNECYPTN